MFPLQSISMLTGLLFGLMALTVWAMLLRRHPRIPTRLWTLGSLAAGVGLVLLHVRWNVPRWMAYQLPTFLLEWSILLRVAALRTDLGLPLRPWRLLAVGLAAMLGYQLSLWLPGVAPHTLFGTGVLVSGVLLLAWYSRALGISTPSRSGLMLAWAEAAAALGLVIRQAWILVNDSEDWVVQELWQLAGLVALAAIAAIYSNLGYLGIALDRRHAAEARARQTSLAALADRDSANRDAAELRQALAEREALMAERDRLLQLLAHEIRQPLHNASGALRVLRQLLLGPQVAAPLLQADAPLRKAEAVLGNVHSVLDNTLAAALLLQQQGPPTLHEVELAVVVKLALGDLAPAHSAAVRVQHDTDLRSAELEPALMRLALRNLLRNAFMHGGSGVQVGLHLSESADPPALLISVIDNGPGLDQAGLAGRKHRGLGLNIARQVAQLHGGRLALEAQPGGGLAARLVLPLPGQDDGPR